MFRKYNQLFTDLINDINASLNELKRSEFENFKNILDANVSNNNIQLKNINPIYNNQMVEESNFDNDDD